MRGLFYSALISLGIMVLAGCHAENRVIDRNDANDMFQSITTLTKKYTAKMSSVSDSAEWAVLCTAFEDSLDKINFRYPPDTDLLLSEGQNDTIMSLMQEYIKVRDSKIDKIMHPVIVTDTIDSIAKVVIPLDKPKPDSL